MQEGDADRKLTIQDYVNEGGRNSRAIGCVRCPCKILQANVGVLHIEPYQLPMDKNGTMQEYSAYWKMTDIFDFHNVAFARATIAHPNIKYLTCADCEQGILGLQTSPKSIYLCHDMVRYI